MDHIYSSLYDLFNQNFAVYGEKRYCRIALGAQLNPQCFVHDDFRAVIFMNEDDDSLTKADAPFLNRFEKHYITLDAVLNDHQRYVVNELKGWIDLLLKNRFEEQKFLLKETSIFPNYSNDSLGILVLQEYGDDCLEDPDAIVERCKKKMMQFATQDIIILAQISDISEEQRNWIVQNYQEIHQISFFERLMGFVEDAAQLEGNLIKKVFAFTYSLKLDINRLSEEQHESIHIRSIQNFKSEQELVKTLQLFFDSKTQSVLILEANYLTDKDHISFIKFIVDKIQKESIDGGGWDGQKSIVLMVHMQRNFNDGNQSKIPLFDEEWEQRVFYDVTMEPFELSEELLLKNTKNIIKEGKIINFEQILANMTEKCLLKLTFEGEVSSDTQDMINDNIYFIQENITKWPEMMQTIKDKIYKQILAPGQRVPDWRDEITCNAEIYTECINVESALKRVIEANIERYLTILLFQLEKHSAFKSFFTDEEKEHGPMIRNIWIHSFNKLKTEGIILQNLSQSNYTTFFSNLSFPFSREEASILRQIFDDQMKFEESPEEHGGIREPIEYFSEQVNEKSRLGPYLQEVVQDQEIQTLYLKDIVKIFLIENLFKPDYLQIVMIILQKIMQNQHASFYDKLYTFLMKQRLFFSLCSIMEIFQQLQGNKIGTQLSDLEQVFQEDLDDLDDQSWEDMIRNILDVVMIKNSYPNAANMKINLDNINNLANLMDKFHSSLHTFKYTVNLQNLSIVKFWSDLTQIIATKPEIEEHFLFKCATKAEKIDAQDEDSHFLMDVEFINMVLDYFEGREKYDDDADAPLAVKDMDDRTIKFMANFFSIILEFNPEQIRFIAKRFEIPQYQNLYKYSSLIFQKILHCSKILEHYDAFGEKLKNNEFEDNGENPEIELPENQYLDILEEVLQTIDKQTKFAVAINDQLKSQISLDANGEPITLHNLPNMTQQFEVFLRYLSEYDELNESSYPHIKQVIAHAFLKILIDMYADLLFYIEMDEAFEETEELKAAREYIDQQLTFAEKPIIKTLQVYCLKVLKLKLNMQTMQAKNYFVDVLGEKYQWIQECEILQFVDQSDIAIDVYPHLQGLSHIEQQIKGAIDLCMRTNLPLHREALKNKFKGLTGLNDHIAIGLAFLKSCYLRYCDPQFQQNKDFTQFYQEELQQILETKTNKQYAQLIDCFISNFTERNLFRMQHDLDQIQTHTRILSCYQLIFLLTHSKTDNPVTGVFYRDNGTFNLANVNQSFLMGLEVELKHFYLLDMYTNFDFQRNPNGNGTYACGCDFVYIATNCGNVTHAWNCPWCNQQIGGLQYNVPIQRPGHVRLTDVQAKQVLQQLVTKYENKQAMGYSKVDPASNDQALSYHGMRPVTWRLIRTLMHVPLYFFHTITDKAFNIDTILKPQDLQPLRKNAKDYLESLIQADFKILFQQLSSGGNDVQAAWLYSTLGNLPEVFAKFKGQLPLTTQVLRNFEQDFNNNLVTPRLDNIAATAVALKKEILNAQGDQDQHKQKRRVFEEIMSELSLDTVNYPGLDLYRLTRQATFEDMMASFNNNKANAKDFPVLKVCLDNYENIQKLRKFYPIIEFTNYLTTRFNHLLKREDARVQKIKDFFQEEDGDYIKKLFESFLVSWHDMGFDQIIQYKCHRLNYQRYSEDSTIINFLADNQEIGGGMCMVAALQELVKIQNKILDDVIAAYGQQKQIDTKYIIDTYQYPVQKVKQNHIIDLKIDDPESIKECSLSSIKYGEGQTLVYDNSRIELKIIQDILHKKYFHPENFEFIQYQLEILIMQGTRSNYVIEIRKKIKQIPFDKDEKNRVDGYLDLLNDRGRDEKVSTLRVLHGGLEKILCFLQNCQEDGDSIIEDFCLKIHGRIEKQYTDKSVLSQVRLKNIIALYENIENRYFPYITECLKPGYFQKEHEVHIRDRLTKLLKHCDLAQEEGGEAKTQEELIPSRQNIQDALLRFMIRCLAGELDYKLPIAQYIIYKEDIWDEEVLTKDYLLNNLEEKIPQDIFMHSIYITYQIMYELNKQKEERPIGPKLEEQKAARALLKNPNINKPVAPPAPPKQNKPKPGGGRKIGL